MTEQKLLPAAIYGIIHDVLIDADIEQRLSSILTDGMDIIRSFPTTDDVEIDHNIKELISETTYYSHRRDR